MMLASTILNLLLKVEYSKNYFVYFENIDYLGLIIEFVD